MAVSDRRFPYGNLTSLAAVGAPASGDVLHFAEELPTTASLQVTVTGTPTFQVDLEGSMDGVTFAQVATLSAVGISSASTTVPYLRARLVSISGGGTVTAVIAASSAVGEKGETGDTGPQGLMGVGVPYGGTTDQILKKASGTDFDVAWFQLTQAAIADLNLGTLTLLTDVITALGTLQTKFNTLLAELRTAKVIGA